MGRPFRHKASDQVAPLENFTTSLRLVLRLPHSQAVEALDRWIGWARRSRIPAFVALQRRIVRHRQAILASIQHRLSNGLVESVNTKLRLITRVTFGFKSPQALVALAMLSLRSEKPQLRARKRTPAPPGNRK